MSKATQRGASSVAIIVGLVVVLVVVGAGAYFLSAPFRTKTQQAYKQFSEWTPENIAKDPVNYLNFAEAQTQAAMEQLKASEISVAMRKSKLEAMKEEAAQKVATGSKVLGELKQLYKEAEATDAFPVKYQNQDRDKTWMQRNILSVNQQVEAQTQLRDRVTSGIETLNAQVNKILEQRGKCEQQLATIATNREMLKVQEITDELKNQLVELNGVLQSTVVASAAAADSSADINIANLAAQSETQVDLGEFDKVMKE